MKGKFIKLTIPAFAVVLLLLAVPATAFTTGSTVGKSKAVKKVQVNKTVKPVKAAPISAKLVSEAKKYGVRTNGLSEAVVKARIIEAKEKLQTLYAEAKWLEIKVQGTDPAVVKRKLEAAKLDQKYKKLMLKAKGLGVVVPVEYVSSTAESGVGAPGSLTRAEFLKAASKKFNVNISGMTEDQALDAINRAFDAFMRNLYTQARKDAKELGIDITGLSDVEALTKVSEEKYRLERMKSVQALADKYGVDITGLSEGDAVIKIKTTSKYLETEFPTPKVSEEDQMKETAQKLGIDITGLTSAEIKARVRAYGIQQDRTNNPQIAAELDASAKELNVDISGLYLYEASEKLIAARKAIEAENRIYLEKTAKEFGIDTTGLSNQQISESIDKAIEARKKSNP